MSNPIKIAKIIFQLGKLHERGEIDYDLSKPIKLIEEHTNQKLKAVADEVEELEEGIFTRVNSPEIKSGYYKAIDIFKEILNKHLSNE